MPKSHGSRALAKWVLIFTLVVLPSLSLGAQLAYNHFEGGSISFQQGLLFVVESMTSTGYGELLPFHSWGMVLFSAFLIFGGIGTIFVLFATAAADYVQKALGNAIPRQGPRGISHHVVIFTDDPTSARLGALVQATGLRHVIVSRDRELVLALLAKGLTAIHGDAAAVEDVARAGVGRARVVVTDQTDEQNVSTILAVRAAVSGVPIFSTVDDPHFAPYLEHAGAEVTLPVKKALGEALARWVIAPVSDMLLATSREYPGLHFAEIPITPSCVLARKSPRDLRLHQRTGATLLGVWRADAYVRVESQDVVLESGSVAVIMANTEQMKRVREEFAVTPRDLRMLKPGDRCIVAGGGHVGMQAASELRGAGLAVTVLDERPSALDGWMAGDATKAEGLLAAGIADASALVVAINGDLRCLLTTLVARSLNPSITIVGRTNREEYSERLMMAGADYAISLSSVASQRLMSLIGVDACPLCSTEMVSGKAVVPESLHGRRLSDIGALTNCGCVVAVIDDGQAQRLSPEADAQVFAGCELTVLGEPAQIQQLVSALAALART